MKFLVYLFLFYVVSRFIFGTLLRVKKEPKYSNNKNNFKEDDELKVKPTASKQDSKKNNSNIGEYVDFEEIKE